MTCHTASQPEGGSMDVLQELLEPIPIHEFLHRAFTRVPFAMPEKAARYTQDFTEADIAAMVEVFIIQVQGCKEYTLRQNTVNPWPVWDTMPADLGYERETSRLRMTCRLEAGDWLYIPSGWWHIARTQAASLHLSIGVMPVT